ncbi:MAG: zinc ribbon protein [Solirubrobacterales bacterium]|nr:zinc ribbon protein [Solirubrobacterales bacterium]
MDQTSGTNPPDAPAAQGPQDSQPTEAPPSDGQPGFRSRGQARRRARFLRRARELAYRDLGGLVFNLHRFGQRNDALVLAKLGTLSHIDAELRAIETALAERHPVTVLREAGITACPRCAAIHGSEDRFCPNCGLPMSRHADLPVAGAPAGEPAPPAPQPAAPFSAAPAPATAAPAGAAPFAVAPAAGAPSTPAQPPGTGQHRVAGPGAGRAPVPPVRATPEGALPAAGSTAGPDEPTEIIHPQAPGS